MRSMLRKVIASGGVAMIGACEWHHAAFLRVLYGGGDGVCLECDGGGGGDGAGVGRGPDDKGRWVVEVVVVRRSVGELVADRRCVYQ